MINLKHLQTVIPVATSGKIQRLIALAWSPNNRKLAACGKDKVVFLFNEFGEQQDKFPTKPLEPRHGENSYSVSALAFSPDSTKLAVAQTDGIIFIYKLGVGFKERKSISNKLVQPDAVVSLIWPNELEILCGLADGKLRHTALVSSSNKGPRSKTFYNPEIPNISITGTWEGSEMAAGFADGRIAVFRCGQSDAPALLHVIQHGCPAFALAYGGRSLFAAGCDKKVIIYDSNAKVLQLFDCNRIGDGKDREFSSACGSPTGLAVVLGSYDRLRVYRWVPKKKVWEDGCVKDVYNMYTITALQWKKDGTRVAVGTLAGGLHLFESVLKKSQTKAYEVAYVAPSHAIVTIRASGLKADLISGQGLEILDVKIMGENCYAIATTVETILICDIAKNLVSEIPWTETEDKEKYYFDNPSVCMMFFEGDLYLIEYGNNNILGIFRTEFLNPHVISVRINERVPKRLTKPTDNKKLAYLLDRKTIAVFDLEYNLTLGYITSASRVDWLELSETGDKLLYRDKKLELMLVDVETMSKNVILNICTFVQWVPGSDVVVAQSNKFLRIWYNIDLPEQFIEMETRGVVYDVVNENHKTCVLIRDGSITREIPLDSSRIEFSTAIDDGDFLRAMIFLENSESNNETTMMWKILAKVALESNEFVIADRACCAYGDIARAKYIRDTIAVADIAIQDGVEESIVLNEVQARIALLNGDLNGAESAFLENGDVESAVSMYETINKWPEAIRVAGSRDRTLIVSLTKNYLDHLLSTGQEEMAANFMEENRNYTISVEMYLDAGLPTKAAKVIQNNYVHFKVRPELIDQIGRLLYQGEYFHEAGELYDTTGQKDVALESYKKAYSFDKAIELARKYFPDLVISLEEEWGDRMYSNRQMDQACNHYIESGKLKKALIAALDGRQWKKANHIISAIDDIPSVADQYLKLGDHYSSVSDIKNAEKCYLKGDHIRKATEMYKEKGLWQDAYRVASKSPLTKKELEADYLADAEAFQKQGKYGDAEKLYLAIDEIDRAISMYGHEKRYEEMLRLVEKYHPSHLDTSRKHVAELLRKDDNFKGAEVYYLKAKEYEAILDMYKSKGLWEDAYRVARHNLGTPDAKKVIFEWAESLGGDLALRLLKRFGYLDECVDYSCNTANYKFALELAPHASKDRKEKIHVLYGKHLEIEQQFKASADHYIQGNMPKAAVEMFLRASMMPEAVEVAEKYYPEALPQLLQMHARALFATKDYAKFETALLKAEKPEIGVQMYKEHGMWTEAFRFCKDYAPAYLQSLQNDYDASATKNPHTVDSTALINQAKEFERLGEYKRAIDCYLKLGTSNTENKALLSKCWTRAGDLTVKFLGDEMAVQIVQALSPMLMGVGNYSQAAILYLQIGMQEQAINALIDGDLWSEATKAAREMGPQMEEYVNSRHTKALKNSGNVEELTDVNLEAALDLLCEQGEWEACLEKAKRDENVYTTYLGKYVIKLINDRNPREALLVYSKYGTPAVMSHYPVYKALAFTVHIDLTCDDYDVWYSLRDLFFGLIRSFESTGNANVNVLKTFEKLLFISHLYANRAAFREVPGLESIASKISVAMLRYTDIVPPERAFFEAGMTCRTTKWNNMGFVFLNHFLDIRDAVEEHKETTIDLDHSDFVNTDIPKNCMLTDYFIVSDEDYNEVKEWVLTASMDRQIQQVLPKDPRGEYEASLITDGELACSPCIVSGYPVFGRNKISFRVASRTANKEDWNKFIMATRSGDWPKLKHIYDFLEAWCGANPNYSL